MQIPLIEADDLCFQYRDVPVLEDVSFTVYPGEFIVIFGPNGGGKTTLLNLLLGFLKPTSGSISFGTQTPDLYRQSIGYVPQKLESDPLFPATTLDVVLMGCVSKTRWWGALEKKWVEKGKHLLQMMGLSEKINAHFGTLSGGEAQRALIARALIHDPSLLLLDEPTANVDAAAEEEILSILMSLNQQKTIILITHHLQPVINRANRLLCMNKQLTEYQPNEVCDHFSLGLYHTDLAPI